MKVLTLVAITGLMALFSILGFADGNSDKVVWSESVLFTNSATINISARHDNPIGLKVAELTLPQETLINSFTVDYIRDLNYDTTNSSIYVTNNIITWTNITVTTSQRYFDNEKVLKKGDAVVITLDDASSDIGTFTYDYMRGMK